MPRNRLPFMVMGRHWWQPLRPVPGAEPHARRLEKKLLQFAKFDTRGMRVQAGDELLMELVDKGFVRLKLDAHVGFRGRTMSHTYGFITEAGWTAVWNEDLAIPKPIPKSQRREKRGRHV